VNDVAQKHVLEDLKPDFRVHVIDAPPLQLSANDIVRVFGNLGNTGETLCGVAVEMRVENDSRLATLGGLIMIKKEETTLYALTAGHQLANMLRNSSLCPELLADDDGTGSDSEDSDGDLQDEMEETSRRSSESAQVLSHDQEEYGQGNRITPAHKRDIGTIVADSFSSMAGISNYDWALVSIDRKYWEPNRLCKQTQLRSGLDDKYMDKPASKEQQKRESTLELSSLPSTTSEPHFSERPVLVITSRGFQKGTLSSNQSCLMTAPGTAFVETFDFTPDTEASNSNEIAKVD